MVQPAALCSSCRAKHRSSLRRMYDSHLLQQVVLLPVLTPSRLTNLVCCACGTEQHDALILQGQPVGSHHEHWTVAHAHGAAHAAAPVPS